MKQQTLEQYQVLVYLVAILAGLLAGVIFPERVSLLEAALWPLLAVLLYATFTQVPLAHLHTAFSDGRFVGAAVVGNFVLVPLIVWGLMHLAPDDPAVRMGILLVLLVPCTDWFITFTHLAGGETKHAIAFSPVSLLLQMGLLPVYLWAFLGTDVVTGMAQREMATAFLGLIALPLVAAFATEKWAERSSGREVLINRLGWLPVPLLALVVFSIAAAQIEVVMDSVGLLAHLTFIFVAFLLIAAALAKLLARLFGLRPTEGRVLAFSLGTRNSFVVLPLALALPASFELAVVVIVFQSLVELFGMVVYLWWVPKKLFPS